MEKNNQNCGDNLNQSGNLFLIKKQLPNGKWEIINRTRQQLIFDMIADENDFIDIRSLCEVDFGGGKGVISVGQLFGILYQTNRQFFIDKK